MKIDMTDMEDMADIAETKDFPGGIKPREIFIYVCERIAEALTEPGFKYRKSKNDIYKNDGNFIYRICFQPSIKWGSTTFAVHISVESQILASWRRNKYTNQNEDGTVITTTPARLTKRAQGWPLYQVNTPFERERSITEITWQINDFAIPFFKKFGKIDILVNEVKSQGFLPHRNNQYGIDVKRKESDFIDCYSAKHEQ